MLFASKTYDLKQLDIKVCLQRDPIYAERRINGIDLNLPFQEDDYLGMAFRDVETKSFLSDEWTFYITGVGQKFVGGVTEFRDKMKKYAIHNGFFYYYHRNDSTYITLECEDADCSFFVKGVVSSANLCFYIDDCELTHNCQSVIRKTTHQMLDSDIVGQCFVNEVMYNPNIRPVDIIVKFKLDYGFDIGYKVAQKSKAKTLEKIYGKVEHSFNKLVWYIEAVKELNPGSVVDLEYDETTNHFKRVFIAYGGCIGGFKHCMHVLYVDGCFVKTMYKGQILAATSKNGNKESEDNWTDFFRNLKRITDTIPHEIIFLSDRGVGLLSAFDQIFPSNPHMYCYHHLQGNLARRYTGRGRSVIIRKVISIFFTCAFSSTEKEYYFNLKELRTVDGEAIIDDFLRDLPLERWCRAFAVGCRFGIMANSIAESFNSWICVEISMAVYSMLEEVRLKQMNMVNERRSNALSWTTRLTPKMEKVLEVEMVKSRRFRVVKSFAGLFEVRDVFSYQVDLNDSTCSCVKWQINSFPCPHALAAIMFARADSPSVKSQAGRPRKRRFKSAFEKFAKKQIVCGRCGKKGNHNKSSCTEPIILV